MSALPISLCVVERNEVENLEECLMLLKGSVSEIIVIDQESDDGSLDIARKYGDIVMTRSNKGFADPDRQLCYRMANPNNWILALDPDEKMSNALREALPRLCALPDIDIVWFPFINEVYTEANPDRKFDISDILGEDPHPRFFRHGALDWPAEAHKFPHWNSVRHLWLDKKFQILHQRSWERILRVHQKRAQVINPQAIAQEMRFCEAVKAKLGL